MILRTTGKDLAEQAVTGGYVGIPYGSLDCQGFVEQVLKDCGVRKPDGSPYNWRGSNSMWRNYIKWKGTIAECKEKFLTREELEGAVPSSITGHILYIRPVDKGLLTFENGIFVPYSECDDLYWLRDQEGIASYFRTIYNDTPDIYIGDCVIERGTVNVLSVNP